MKKLSGVWSWIFALTLMSAGLSGEAQVGGVRDNAGFFSDSAKSDANRAISEIERRFRKDLVVETFKEVPDDIKSGVNLQDRSAAGRMFESWAEKQARQLRVNGVYALISKQPAHLHIVVGNETQRRAFTLRDRDTLVSTMLGRLQQKQNDQALQDGVNFVLTTMAGHAAAGNNSYAPAPVQRSVTHVREQKSSSWGWVLPVVIGAFVLFILFRVIGSMMGGGSSSGSSGMPMGSGGGGFMSSLLGGLFGAAAGMWLYDKFTGGGNAWGSDYTQVRNDDPGFGGQDTDYSGSGSDFGGDSGGDSGGGDFGGGGDDGGGGGGDF